MSILSTSLNAGRRLFYPPVCPGCLVNLARPDGTGWCWACRDRLRPLDHPRCPGCGGSIDGVLELCGECLVRKNRPWREAVSVYPYGGYVRELIHRFKYRGATLLAPPFARTMADGWLNHAAEPDIDLIVPLPLHYLRRFTRGYNQARLLGRGVSRILQRPLADVLRRVQWSRPQIHLNIDERRKNVSHIFQVCQGADLKGAGILLIDDVFTTGATFSAAAGALHQAEVKSISILSLARG